MVKMLDMEAFMYRYKEISLRASRGLEAFSAAREVNCHGSSNPAPGPQVARNGRSSLPRSRSGLESAARACPGAAMCSKVLLELGRPKEWR